MERTKCDDVYRGRDHSRKHTEHGLPFELQSPANIAINIIINNNTEHCIACTPKEDGIALGSSDNVCSATCPAIQTDLPGC